MMRCSGECVYFFSSLARRPAALADLSLGLDHQEDLVGIVLLSLGWQLILCNLVSSPSGQSITPAHRVGLLVDNPIIRVIFFVILIHYFR